MLNIFLIFLLTAGVFGNPSGENSDPSPSDEHYQLDSPSIDLKEDGEDIEDQLLRELFDELNSDSERRWAYPRMARVQMVPAGPNSTVYGWLKVYEFKKNGLYIKGKIYNLTPGLHGFHVHSNGSTDLNCTLTGPHFNPDNVTHGGPQSLVHHAGDLGNIFASSNGVAKIEILTRQISLDPSSNYYIMYKSFAVHDGQDDLGLGTAATSSTTGNSGNRVACGIIVPRHH